MWLVFDRNTLPLLDWEIFLHNYCLFLYIVGNKFLDYKNVLIYIGYLRNVCFIEVIKNDNKVQTWPAYIKTVGYSKFLYEILLYEY